MDRIAMDRIEALESKVEQQAKEILEIKNSLKRLYAKNTGQIMLGGPEELESLKTLLESDQWPAAVESFLICNENSEQDKEDRADGILDIIIDVHLEKLAFLDFGCGEGHVVAHSVIQAPAKAIGYDIVESPRWESWHKDSKGTFTTNWQTVKENGPYNAILLYDVLDHITGDNNSVIECLRNIRSVMAPNAKVFVRCHPWCARHATHLYHKINKAYVHLVFTPKELEDLGFGGGMPTRSIIHPIMTYGDWFKSTGFKVHRKEQVTKSNIEPFFVNTAIVAQRIKTNYKNSIEAELRSGTRFPPQLEFQFLDYVLA